MPLSSANNMLINTNANSSSHWKMKSNIDLFVYTKVILNLKAISNKKMTSKISKITLTEGNTGNNKTIKLNFNCQWAFLFQIYFSTHFRERES